MTLAEEPLLPLLRLGSITGHNSAPMTFWSRFSAASVSIASVTRGPFSIIVKTPREAVPGLFLMIYPGCSHPAVRSPTASPEKSLQGDQILTQ
jgi:hypothetical protein